jgi:hypothetical protein
MEIQKYCPACAEEGYRRRNAENWKREHATSIYRICRTCHVEFERKPRTNQLHCQPCIDAKAERKANPPKMYCSVCHKEFKHKNPRVKRCSVECEKIRKKQYAQAQKAADSARRNAHRKAMRMAEPPPVVVVSGGMHPCYFGGDRCHSVVCQLIYASGGIA